jgi:Holliday junction resolvase RusA-like endonuclease
MISFFVPMTPKAKQGDRSRIASMKNGQQFIAHYKDSAVQKAERRIEQYGMPVKPTEPLQGPLFLILRAYFEVPASYTKKKRNSIISFETWPIGKPDSDNLCKLVLDALGTSKLFFKNDSQFVFVVIIKQYGEHQGLSIKLGEMAELPNELMTLANEFERMFAK